MAVQPQPSESGIRCIIWSHAAHLHSARKSSSI